MEADIIRAIGVGIAVPVAFILSAVIIFCVSKYTEYKVEKECKAGHKHIYQYRLGELVPYEDISIDVSKDAKIRVA